MKHQTKRKNLLETTYFHIHNFCKTFEPIWNEFLKENGYRKRLRPRRFTLSETMTLLIVSHHYRFRDFKAFYNYAAFSDLKKAFPGLPSYSR